MSEDWHYYLLSFSYNGETVNCGPGDDDLSRDASAACFSAEDRVEQLAKEANLEMCHAYSWPDGSLYKYVRTKKEMTYQDFDDVFYDMKNLREGKRFIHSDGRRVHQPIVSVGECNKVDHKKISQVWPYISVEEKFTCDNKSFMALSDQRNKQREECFATYHKHREECPDCPKPTGFACDVGSKLCTEAHKAAYAFIDSLSAA